MSLRWAQTTIAALADAGVRDVVVCPGSRSAPLAVAAAGSGLRLTPIIDERSAAFFALGQARATGLPSAVICTSGTAGAHFFPAIIEASMAGVPMIIVTADRPPELQGRGAPQTIDQRDLYGSFVRRSIDLGCARDSERAEALLADQVCAAVTAARGPHPGPVHINAPARKPLLADDGLDRPLRRVSPPPPPRLVADSSALEKATAMLAGSARTLCVAGPIAATTPMDALVRLCDELAIPLCAEAASQARFCGSSHIASFDEILRERGFDDELAPELILEVGAPPTSAGYARALAARPDIERVTLRPYLHQDPVAAASLEIIGELSASIGALGGSSSSGDFAGHWRRADATARARFEADLDADPMTGQAATRCVVAQLPAGAQLAVGNSLAIRWLDQSCAAPSIPVLHQRGVSGIDGLIAGAVGAAAASRRPTCLLVGDVSFAHDVGSLAVAAGLDVPLAICVLDNRGGQIFAELPYAARLDAGTRDDLFITRPRLDIEVAAAAFGLSSATASDPTELATAVSSAISNATTTIIRAVIAPRSRPVL